MLGFRAWPTLAGLPFHLVPLPSLLYKRRHSRLFHSLGPSCQFVGDLIYSSGVESPATRTWIALRQHRKEKGGQLLVEFDEIATEMGLLSRLYVSGRRLPL